MFFRPVLFQNRTDEIIDSMNAICCAVNPSSPVRVHRNIVRNKRYQRSWTVGTVLSFVSFSRKRNKGKNRPQLPSHRPGAESKEFVHGFFVRRGKFVVVELFGSNPPDIVNVDGSGLLVGGQSSCKHHQTNVVVLVGMQVLAKVLHNVNVYANSPGNFTNESLLGRFVHFYSSSWELPKEWQNGGGLTLDDKISTQVFNDGGDNLNDRLGHANNYRRFGDKCN